MNGILYVAIGEYAYEQALLSRLSVQEHMRGISCTVVTNVLDNSNPFDVVIRSDSDEYKPADKVSAIAGSQYDRTVFLDADTFVCMDISELFSVLDRFDVAGVHTPNRVNWPVRDVPRVFPEINSGVIAYKAGKRTERFLDRWVSALGSVDDLKFRGDQGALREALYHSDVRLCVLPPEFNLRVTEKCPLGADAVRVLHGGPPSRDYYEKVRQHVNAVGVPRLYVPGEECTR